MWSPLQRRKFSSPERVPSALHLQVAGARLSYEEHGTGEPLLLLEGMGGDVPGWRRNVPNLVRAGFRVIPFDFRGSGFSDRPPGPYSMAMFVDDTIGLMDGLGIDAAHVYGQSMGGMVALNLTLRHPGRVRKLVLGCTHAGGTSVIPARPDPEDSGPRVLWSRRFWAEHRDHIAEDLAASSGVPPPRADLQARVVRDHDVAARLGEIACPTFVVAGTDDRVVNPENAKLLALGIPGAELWLVEGAGHLFHSERSGEVDARIIEFLRR